MRVQKFLDDSAARLSARSAIAVGGAAHSFAELAEKSDRLGFAMIERGMRPGDRVVVSMDNCFATVVSIFAVFKAGGVLTPIDAEARADTLRRILDDCRAAGVMTHARLASVAAAAVATSPWVRLVVLAGGDWSPPSASCVRFEDAVTRSSPIGALAADRPGDAAGLLVYAPAASELGAPATVTHRQILNAVDGTAATFGGFEGPVVMRFQAASMVSDLYRLMAAVKVGLPVVLEDGHDRRSAGSRLAGTRRPSAA